MRSVCFLLLMVGIVSRLALEGDIQVWLLLFFWEADEEKYQVRTETSTTCYA